MANKRNKKQPLKRAGAIKKTKGKKKALKAAAKSKVEKVVVKKGKQSAVTSAAAPEKASVQPKEKGETSLVEDNESPAATSSTSE